MGGKRLVMIAVLTVAVLVLSYGGLRATSTPEFCASCHEIKPHVDAWRQMAHKDVDCMKCHADSPTTMGYLTRKVKGSMEVVHHLTNQYDAKDLKPKINEENCRACHDGSNLPKAKDVIGPGAAQETSLLKMTHKSHYEEKLTCMSCHKTVAHGKKPFTAEDRQVPELMTTSCVKCHDVRSINSKGPDRRQWPYEELCTKCHRSDPRNMGEAFSNKYIPGMGQ